MESLLARALESKLKYWLKSFSRDQFKLQGRTVQLCNLDINGEALHSSIGLPPTLMVSQARVGKLEIKVPPFANVQIEPVVVEIDKLDLVLSEKLGSDMDACTNILQGGSSTAKSTGYGFADKIADGVTLQVGTVNLMLETHGGTTGQKGAAWTPPLAAITIHHLLLYTTNEYWQAVNLKEARDFSINQKCIFVFKALEWSSLSVDLLPHPNMFNDEALMRIGAKQPKLEEGGAKRLLFGGERFLDNISGEAHITMHRTEQNNALGLEVQVHIPEAVCAALSEPGLRALLRFMTGMYVCMNRGDMGPKFSQSQIETAEKSKVSATVDHVFIRIKDTDFQLELLIQDLHYVRSSVTNGNTTKTLSQLCVGDFFLRDTFHPPGSTLVQPVMYGNCYEPTVVPDFASEELWPKIHPLDHQTNSKNAAPLLCMFSIKHFPSPFPPTLASELVVQCQSLKINLQEESCLRIASFLVDGVVVERGVVMPANSVDSVNLSLKQLDLALPVDVMEGGVEFGDIFGSNEFSGITFHAKDFVFVQSPAVSFKVLELKNDPACFTLWPGQPIDASQRKWVMSSRHLGITLETGSLADLCREPVAGLDLPERMWVCIEISELCFEAVAITGDGAPLLLIPPPGGIVRFGLHCQQLTSNTSVEQLFFVLMMYEHFGKVYESLAKITSAPKKEGFSRETMPKKVVSFVDILEACPSDTAIKLALDILELNFLESLSQKRNLQGSPVVQIIGNGISLEVSHRTLGGAMAIASRIYCLDVRVECVETDIWPVSSKRDFFPCNGRHTSLKPVFWTCNSRRDHSEDKDDSLSLKKKMHFIDIHVVNVIPYRPEDAGCHTLNVEAIFRGVRLGGGMSYSEALLHHFGLLGPDGGPGEGLRRVVQGLSSGPMARLLEPPSHAIGGPTTAEASCIEAQDWELGVPDEIQVNIQLQDWIFALESFDYKAGGIKEGHCWHSAFQSLCVSAQGNRQNTGENMQLSNVHPMQRITVAVEGLEFIKPWLPASMLDESINALFFTKGAQNGGTYLEDRRAYHGLSLEAVLCVQEDDKGTGMQMGQWDIENVKVGITKPVEVQTTKEEIKYLIRSLRTEMAAASRIAAGIMQMMQLQGSIGQAAIDQLNSIGCGSLEKLLITERARCPTTHESMPSQSTFDGKGDSNHRVMNPDVINLRKMAFESQNSCIMLNESLLASCSEVPVELASLVQQLENIQKLVEKIHKLNEQVSFASAV